LNLGTAHVDTFVLDNLPPKHLQPDFLFTLPEFQFPTRLNGATELVDRAVRDKGWGSRLAILAPGGVRWRYADLDAAVARIAHVLTQDLGLVPGNRLLIRGVNSPLLAAIWLGVIKAGGIAVTTMPLLRARELGYIIKKAQITHVLCERALEEELWAAMRHDASILSVEPMFFNDNSESGLERAMTSKSADFAPVDTYATDPCLISFTSGTTGTPKATVHSHRDVMTICNSFPRSVLKASSDDRFIGSPPLAFTFGLGGQLLFPLHIGAATVLLGQASPPLLARAISEYQATICFSAPTSYRMMATEWDCDFSTLRKCVSAGEVLPVATRELWKQRTDIDIIDGLGTTEMLHIFVSMSGEDGAAHPGAVGRAIPGYEVAVLDARGRQLPAGKTGRLAVKGPTGCRYLADARQRDYVHAGWNLTGDTGWLDERGHFFYQARTDDLIVSAGYNISPVEVEDVMLTHPAVRECAVVGVPDHQRGTIVKAFIVLGDGYEARQELIDELQAFAKGVIAPYKYPRAIEFCAELPRTETGKIQRFRCVGASARERSQVRRKADSELNQLFVQDKLIRFHHCDPAGIVFYPNYLILMNEVLQDWFQTALRIDYSALFIERRLGIPTVRLECDFLAPSRLGDTVRFSVNLHRIGTTSFELRFVCVGAGQPTERVRLRAVLVCTSLDDQHPIPIPDDIRAAMQRWVSSENETGAA
jgi:2-aminobenzoate-CoA ligase